MTDVLFRLNLLQLSPVGVPQVGVPPVVRPETPGTESLPNRSLSPELLSSPNRTVGGLRGTGRETGRT